MRRRRRWGVRGKLKEEGWRTSGRGVEGGNGGQGSSTGCIIYKAHIYRVHHCQAVGGILSTGRALPMRSGSGWAVREDWDEPGYHYCAERGSGQVWSGDRLTSIMLRIR